MKKLPLILAVLLIATAGLAQGARTYTFTDAEKKERDAHLGDEAARYAKTGHSRYSFWPSAMDVSASVMRNVYASNQIDGELRYKGKYVRIEGLIAGFHSGIGDQPSVTLGDSRSLIGNPVAKFPREKARALASLHKGQKVAFFCTVSGVVVGTPFLRDCSLQEEVQAKALTLLGTRLDALLAGKIADAEMATSFRLIRYASWSIRAPHLCVKKAVKTCPNSESVLFGEGRSHRRKDVDYETITAKVLIDSDDSTYQILTSLFTRAFADSVIPEHSVDQKTRDTLKDVVY